jgi:DNA-binding CsgD family transcriptional regulator
MAEVQASTELAAVTGESYGLVVGHSVLALISLHRNDVDGAVRAARATAGQHGGTITRYRAHWALWARALVLEAQGRQSEAFATLADGWDQCTRLGLTLEYRIFGADLVRLALTCGNPVRAQEVAASVTELADQNPQVRTLAAAALRCQGLAADDAGLLCAAADAYSGGPRPLELALTAQEAGTALVRQGHAGQGRPLLEEAVAIYERLGAARDLARAEAALRRTGINNTGRRRGGRDRPRAGWSSLTPTERKVASLVAEGLSNSQIGDRLYISHRTVQTHLVHVFAKLDLTSRAQLAAEVTRRGSTAV